MTRKDFIVPGDGDGGEDVRHPALEVVDIGPEHKEKFRHQLLHTGEKLIARDIFFAQESVCVCLRDGDVPGTVFLGEPAHVPLRADFPRIHDLFFILLSVPHPSLVNDRSGDPPRETLRCRPGTTV